MSSTTAPILRYVELPPGPGTKVTIRLPAGNDMLKPVPLPGQGFTLDFGGDVWRSELRSAAGDIDGMTLELELEIVGRYDKQAAHYKRLFALQQQARDLGRNIMDGGSGWRGSFYGAVQASYPQGSRIARQDSWQCHHEHPDDLSALECALSEVRRLADGGSYEPCNAGPDCGDRLCRRDWARLARRGPRNSPACG